MKKIAAYALIVLVLPFGAFGQSVPVYESVSNSYRVYSEISESHAAELSRNLDALLDFFTSHFRFESGGLKSKMKVRILADKSRYDEYLKALISQTREDFIYLHYSDPEKSELVGYATDEENFRISLNHQAFIQYFRAFRANPPLWLREGFAVFFEKLAYDPASGSAVYYENLAWLDTLKAFTGGGGKNLLPLQTLLGMTVEGAREKIDVFYPQAWGIVSFLLNSPNKDYTRILWDAVASLQADASLERNVERVYERSFKWYDEGLLTEDFLGYLEIRKSFRAVVQEGIDAYSRNKLDAAEEAFAAAREMEIGNFMPPYYLGLISYARKNYSVAEHHYKTALENGAQPALIYYALGINSYADNRTDEAISYLKFAAEIDPSYEQKTDELLKKLQK
jgi:hypothetical protein